jgi:hypothetical protein
MQYANPLSGMMFVRMFYPLFHRCEHTGWIKTLLIKTDVWLKVLFDVKLPSPLAQKLLCGEDQVTIGTFMLWGALRESRSRGDIIISQKDRGNP